MRRPSRTANLNVEPLESRVVPAGILTFAAFGTEPGRLALSVAGDDLDNGLEISAGAAGRIVLRALDGTRFAGGSDRLVLAAGISSVTVDMKGGNDRVVVTSRSEADPRWPHPASVAPLSFLDPVTVLGGAGNDVVTMRDVKAGSDVLVRGDAGNDVVVMENVQVAGKLDLLGATGANSVLLRNATVTGATNVSSGAGADAVGLINSTFTGNALVTLRAGNDSVSAEGSTFKGQFSLPRDANSGTDKLTTGVSAANTIQGTLSAAGWEQTLEKVADVHFTYEGDAGPERWGALTPAFLLTSVGRQQTPVAIDTAAAVATALPSLDFAYQANSNLGFVHNGHTVQLNFATPALNKLTVAGNTYDLLQLHFHTDSEHTVDGESFPLELHLVHRDAAGNLLVVTVFIKEGAANPAFDPLVANLPNRTSTPSTTVAGPFNPLALLPTVRSIYAYSGSLTTPPGSEGVSFALFTTPVELSAAQIQSFKTALGEPNNRPIQPLNDRVVFKSA